MQNDKPSISSQNASPASITPTDNKLQNIGRKELATIIGGGGLSLFVAFITGALQSAGVISIGLAHLLLFCAWFVVVIGIFTSEWLFSASKKQMFIVVSLTAVIVGCLLYGVDIWMVGKRAKMDKATTQKQLNSELKNEVAKFVSRSYLKNSFSTE